MPIAEFMCNCNAILLACIDEDNIKNKASLCILSFRYMYILYTEPDAPRNVRITDQVHHKNRSSTVTILWDPPQGKNATLDNYKVIISPTSVSNSTVHVVYTPSWSTIMKHNVNYTVSVFATNCAGNGATTDIIDFIISK